jgi:hypothetical protein
LPNSACFCEALSLHEAYYGFLFGSVT